MSNFKIGERVVFVDNSNISNSLVRIPNLNPAQP